MDEWMDFGINPDTILELLRSDDLFLQSEAIDNVSTFILISNNVDDIYDVVPPRPIVSTLGKLFVKYPTIKAHDEPEQVLSVLTKAANCIRSFLELSEDLSKLFVFLPDCLKNMANYVRTVDLSDNTQRDLVDGLIKTFEFVSRRYPDDMYKSGAFTAILDVLQKNRHLKKQLFNDVILSARHTVDRVCTKMKASTIQNSDIGFSEDLVLLADLSQHSSKATSFSCLKCIQKLLELMAKGSKLPPDSIANASTPDGFEFISFIINQLEKSTEEDTPNNSINSPASPAGDHFSHAEVQTLTDLLKTLLTTQNSEINFQVSVEKCRLNVGIEAVLVNHKDFKAKVEVCKLTDKVIDHFSKKSSEVCKKVLETFVKEAIGGFVFECSCSPHQKVQLECLKNISKIIDYCEKPNLLKITEKYGTSLADCLYKCHNLDSEDFLALLCKSPENVDKTPSRAGQLFGFRTIQGDKRAIPLLTSMGAKLFRKEPEVDEKIPYALVETVLAIVESILTKNTDFIKLLTKTGMAKKMIDQASDYNTTHYPKLFDELSAEQKTQVLSRFTVPIAKLTPRLIAMRLLQLTVDIVDTNNLKSCIISKELEELKTLANEKLSFDVLINAINAKYSIYDITNSGILKKLDTLRKNMESSHQKPKLLSPEIVKKLIDLFEYSEKIPIYEAVNTEQGDSPVRNLSYLKKLIKLRINKSNLDMTKVLNSHTETIRVEPGVNCKQLAQELHSMTYKQWFEYPRSAWGFTESIENKKFEYEHDFDDCGVINYLLTNGETSTKPRNALKSNVVFVTSSDGHDLDYGLIHMSLNNSLETSKKIHVGREEKPWLAFDLGVKVQVDKYSLVNSNGFAQSALRNWSLMASEDCQHWVILREHKNDTSLRNGTGCAYTWNLKSEASKKGYRYFKIRQDGKNSGGNDYISISGFEVYGTVVSKLLEWPGKLETVVHKRVVENQSGKSTKKSVSKIRSGGSGGFKKEYKKIDHDGTRTHNLPIRSRTRYPLRHTASYIQNLSLIQVCIFFYTLVYKRAIFFKTTLSMSIFEALKDGDFDEESSFNEFMNRLFSRSDSIKSKSSEKKENSSIISFDGVFFEMISFWMVTRKVTGAGRVRTRPAWGIKPGLNEIF